MFQATVNSVVPDDLTENRPVSDLFQGGTQVQNSYILSVLRLFSTVTVVSDTYRRVFT